MGARHGWVLAAALLAAAPAYAQEDDEVQPIADEPMGAAEVDASSEATEPTATGNPRMALRGAARPITMPRYLLRVSAFMSGANADLPLTGTDFVFALQLGAGFAITDDLEIGLGTERAGLSAIGAGQFARSGWRPTGEGVLSFVVADGNLDLGDIPIYGRYRVWHNEMIEIGAEIGVLVPTYSDLAFRFAVPVRVHVGEMFALDTGLYTSMVFGDQPGKAASDDFWGALFVPIRGVLSPVDWLSVALTTGLHTGPFDNEYFAIPLGVEAVASFPMGAESLIDLVAGFEWPAFLRPGTNNADTVEASTWVLSAGARFYFALGVGE